MNSPPYMEAPMRKLLLAITRAQAEFVNSMDTHELFGNLLENLLSITDSEYGFIGEIFHDPDDSVYMKTHAISNIAWNAQTLKYYEENKSEGLIFRNTKTLFGAVMTSAKPLISNDPDKDPRSGGRPEGHPPLRSFMGLPFFSGKEFIGMVAMANRPGGYDESLIEFLQPFLTTCGNIVQAFRNDRGRIAAEESLRESEIKTRTILATVASGIITINTNRIIRNFNPAAERIFEYSAEEVIGKNVNILMPEPYHAAHDQYVTNYVATGVKKIIGIGREVVGKRKDGTVFPLELAVNEMFVGNERMFVGSLTDITLRKQAELSLIAAKEAAEQATRVKSEFLNMISHELRTPLTVILGNIPMLTNPDNLPDSREIAEIAKDIETDGHHLLTLINDLLDISKIDAGKMQLHPETLSVSEVMEHAVTMIKPLIVNKGLSIRANIRDMEIRGDQVRIKQILLNLLGNAIKFTDNGSIFIRTFSDNDMAYFEIKDTGCGIPENEIPHIFDVFRQVDSSSTRKASGSGLGLTITQRLVRLHGGDITVKSKTDHGSTFVFSIPLAKEKQE